MLRNDIYIKLVRLIVLTFVTIGATLVTLCSMLVVSLMVVIYFITQFRYVVFCDFNSQSGFQAGCSFNVIYFT